MATIVQDLKLKTDPTTIVHPNIEADNIPASAITAAKIAASTITSAKLASNSVTNAKIASSAVTDAKIASGAVISSKIASGAVTASKIESGAVQTSHFAPGAVDTNAIADESVSYAKLKIQNHTTANVLSAYTTLADFILWLKSIPNRKLVCEGHPGGAFWQDLHFAIDQNVTKVAFSFFDFGADSWKTVMLETDSDYTTFMVSYDIRFTEIQ